MVPLQYKEIDYAFFVEHMFTALNRSNKQVYFDRDKSFYKCSYEWLVTKAK